MGVKVSGGSFTVLGVGLRWDRTPGDEAVARAVVIFLEDRRLLFGARHVEDEAPLCVVSGGVPNLSDEPNHRCRAMRAA